MRKMFSLSEEDDDGNINLSFWHTISNDVIDEVKQLLGEPSLNRHLTADESANLTEETEEIAQRYIPHEHPMPPS